MPKHCLICEKPIETDHLGVHDATIWTSHGNYGSGVYDPSGSEFLEAFICDACLTAKKDLMEQVKVRQFTEEIERRPPSF